MGAPDQPLVTDGADFTPREKPVQGLLSPVKELTHELMEPQSSFPHAWQA